MASFMIFDPCFFFATKKINSQERGLNILIAFWGNVGGSVFEKVPTKLALSQIWTRFLSGICQ